MKTDLLKAVKLFGVALAFVLAAVFLSSLITDDSTPTTTLITRPFVECPRNTNGYENITKKLTLVQNISSRGIPNKGFEGGKQITIEKTGGGFSDIACGYLLFKASVNDKPLEQEHMNLYMGAVASSRGIRYGVQFGGHIVPSKKNRINKETDIDNKTEILFPLDAIPYSMEKTRKNILYANWVSLLNVADKIDFYIALNSSVFGEIELVEIAYKCWDAQTGQETDDCELKLAD